MSAEAFKLEHPKKPGVDKGRGDIKKLIKPSDDVTDDTVAQQFTSQDRSAPASEEPDANWDVCDGTIADERYR